MTKLINKIKNKINNRFTFLLSFFFYFMTSLCVDILDRSCLFLWHLIFSMFFFGIQYSASAFWHIGFSISSAFLQ